MCLKDLLLFLGLRLVDGRDFLSFGSQHRRLLVSVGLCDLCTSFALGLHLLLHGVAHAVGRCDVLELHAVDFHSPFVGGVVEDIAQLGVDGVSGRECLVELKFSDDVTQCGLRQLLDGQWQVLDFVDRLVWVDNLIIEQRVDGGCDVVLGDDVLLREVEHLLTHVDFLTLREFHHHPAVERVDGIAHVDGSRLLEDGPYDVDAR